MLAYTIRRILLMIPTLLGVAILGPNGPVAALHLIGSLSEWTPSAFRQRYAPLAVEAANAINRG